MFSSKQEADKFKKLSGEPSGEFSSLKARYFPLELEETKKLIGGPWRLHLCLLDV